MSVTDPHHISFLQRCATIDDARKLLDNAKRLPEIFRAVDSHLVLRQFDNDPEVRRMVNDFDLPPWGDAQLWSQLQAMAAGEMTTYEELNGCGIRLACQALVNPSLVGVAETPAGRLMRTLTLAEQLSDLGATTELRRAGWAWHRQPRTKLKTLFRNHPALRERISRFAPPQLAVVRLATDLGQRVAQLSPAAKVAGLVGAGLLLPPLLLLRPSGTPAAQTPTPVAATPSPEAAPASVSDSFSALLAQPTMSQEMTAGPVVVLRDGLDQPLVARLGSLPVRVRLVPVRWPVGVRTLPATSDWLTERLVSELTGLPEGDDKQNPLVVYLEDVDGQQQRVVVRRRNGETIGVAVGRPVPTAAPPASKAVLEMADAEYRTHASARHVHVLLAMARATAGNALDAYRARAVEAQIAWLTEPNDQRTLALLRRLQLLAVGDVAIHLTDREKDFLHRVRDKAPLGASPAEAVDKEIRLVAPEIKGGP